MELNKEVLSDISARIPYGVMFKYQDWDEDAGEYVVKFDKLYSVNADGYVRGCEAEDEFYIDEVSFLLVPMPDAPNSYLEAIHRMCTSYGEHCWQMYQFCYMHHLDVNDFIDNEIIDDATLYNVYKEHERT